MDQVFSSNLWPVSTDRWPVDFKYISRRLVTEIVQQHEAAQSRYDMSWSLRFKLLGLTIQKRQLDYANRFDLARRATEAVVNLTGTLEVDGEYIRGELDLHTCAFPVLMGWDNGGKGEVALLVSDQVDHDGGTFVALIGSVENYIGHQPSPPGAGFCPSDLDGLNGILATSLEPSDAKISKDFMGEDARWDDLDRMEAAVRIARGAKDTYPSTRLDFLAKSHYHLHDVTIRGEHFAHFLLGAPVWAATPRPRPFPEASSDRSRP